MNVAQHAKNILAAWSGADPVSFELELESALHCCRGAAPVGRLEYEQQEVLQSVVERLRSVGAPGSKSGAQEVHAGFALLAHLSQRAAA
ncbi:MAG TPA: hypothetical protein VK604_18585 [Bryobacteraceae bacterium]|nr:hypothetical protein [Bryobacteraceae bacterium]